MPNPIGQIGLAHEIPHPHQRCVHIFPCQPHALRADVDADIRHRLAQFIDPLPMHHRSCDEAEADGLAVQELDAGARFQRIDDEVLDALDVARAPACTVIGRATPFEGLDNEGDAVWCQVMDGLLGCESGFGQFQGMGG
jgi:hypothetical protein